MSKALEMVFAEMTLKDLASKGLEKIGKASKAAAKGIDVVEKGLAAVNAASKDEGTLPARWKVAERRRSHVGCKAAR